MFDTNLKIADIDEEISAAIKQENLRQEQHIELIASENYCSQPVMEAQGCSMTNKYAEGYPGKRYYGGCEYVDIVEKLAIERACELFGAKFANVQPHSGSSANSAVYMALCQPNDTILGMSLAHGGHLSHGAKVSFSGKIYKSVQYTLDENGLIDFNEVESLAIEHKPKMIVAGFSAYSQLIDWSEFRRIADKVNAFLLVDIAHVAGLIAAGLYPNPVEHAHVVTSTTHKTLRGPRSGFILSNDEQITKKLNSAIFPGYQGGPLMHIIAAKAVAFKEALQPTFKQYQQKVIENANAMAERLIAKGLGVVSGGTKNHLVLVDLRSLGITGKILENSLGNAYITVNKNAVPDDPQSPFVTSGIRIGTPAITTRGFKVAESVKVADWIAEIAHNVDDLQLQEKIKAQVIELGKKFPVYGS